MFYVFKQEKKVKRLVRWLGVITPEYTEPVFFHLLKKKCIEINLWRQYQMKKKNVKLINAFFKIPVCINIWIKYVNNHHTCKGKLLPLSAFLCSSQKSTLGKPSS